MFYFLNHQNLILHEDIVVVVSIATILASGLEQDVTLQTCLSVVCNSLHQVMVVNEQVHRTARLSIKGHLD